MYKPRIHRKKLNKIGMDTVFVLIVFLLFVLCLLASALSFAKIYKSFGDDINARFEGSQAQALIMQKLRFYDNSGSVYVTDSGGIKSLCFKEEIDGESYVTYIYCHDGMLCELFTEESTPFDAANGNVLTAAEEFTPELDGSSVRFTLKCHGKASSSLYTLRSGERQVGV